MSLAHYYFGREGEKIKKHIETYNITFELVVDRYTNTILSKCLASMTPKGREAVLSSYR